VNQVLALAVDGLSGDARLKRPALMQADVTQSEPGDASAHVRVRYQYDGEGRVVEEDRDGRVVEGVPFDGDESIVRHVYTGEDALTGVRDLECESITLDGGGHEVTHARRLFGDAGSEAPLGQPGKGWEREELGYLAGENRWVPQKLTSYDSNGNAIRTVAGAVQRDIGYDA